VLVQVVAIVLTAQSMPIGLVTPLEYEREVDASAASAYLHTIDNRLPGDVQTCVYEGVIVDALTRAVSDLSITDLVLASHGRTGLSRVILGSIADELIHRLHCPIVVVPALSAGETPVMPAEGPVAAGV
jgi:nucleotide-binding universal stress UspA family protein